MYLLAYRLRRVMAELAKWRRTSALDLLCSGGERHIGRYILNAAIESAMNELYDEFVADYDIFDALERVKDKTRGDMVAAAREWLHNQIAEDHLAFRTPESHLAELRQHVRDRKALMEMRKAHKAMREGRPYEYVVTIG